MRRPMKAPKSRCKSCRALRATYFEISRRFCGGSVGNGEAEEGGSALPDPKPEPETLFSAFFPVTGPGWVMSALETAFLLWDG